MNKATSLKFGSCFESHLVISMIMLTCCTCLEAVENGALPCLAVPCVAVIAINALIKQTKKGS